MGWYDLFSRFYDSSLEPLYGSQRAAAAEALRLEPGSVVLDLPCGTGQSFDVIAPRARTVIGADLSTGMLAKAGARIAKNGWSNVHLIARDVHAIDRAAIAEAAGREVAIDRLHVFLGMTAFPRHEEAFARLWDLLAPGGRCVIVDVHADPIGFQGRMVNLVARADITRRWWEPLERAARGFTRVELESKPEHGGTIYVASGDKP